MSELKSIMMDIAASLYINPASAEDLRNRKFLANKSQYGVEVLLHTMENKDWIYYKNFKYYTYKRTVREVLNPNGYELQ